MGAETRVEVAARVESLETVRAFVEKACRLAGADAEACFDLKLAVDEACTNIIEHGYAGRPDGTIALICDATEDTLRVTILDHGRSFRPGSVAPADLDSDWEDRPVGGLGWHFILNSVDAVDYVPDPAAGNRLILTKRSRK